MQSLPSVKVEVGMLAMQLGGGYVVECNRRCAKVGRVRNRMYVSLGTLASITVSFSLTMSRLRLGTKEARRSQAKTCHLVWSDPSRMNNNEASYRGH